ncbi:hypothetical protein B0H17DRAFT_1186337 [Mycena rosella]|uniref:Uncharacterized protein n=1 Tax=Mycena rosella TaxID=1033263 RepID=A0AAD7CMK9_MYCRO|nr:hypothetical protein B0H17DRAFT_1186337 [Mycena rosella]
MGNNESNDPRMSAQNISRLAASENTRLDVEAPAFHPKLIRSDTTAAQAGSPPSSRLDDEQPSDKRDPDGSTSTCANCSFPLPESALPITFDTSGDLVPAQLSHYFPLPPTKIDANPASANFTSSTPLHKASMTSLTESMGHASLQETLDALWAPPKHVPVRISAPVSPLAKTDEPLIDFSDQIPMMPSFITCSTPTALLSSGDTSFEVKSSGGVLSASQSGDGSTFDVNVKTSGSEPIGGVPMFREETLTQMVARHPDLDLGPLDSSPKKINGDAARMLRSGSVSSSVGEDEPVQLPPFTYADAANIASKYPELAVRVLNEPLATPVQTNVMLPDEDEAEHFFTPQEVQNSSLNADPVFVMPEHTPDRPNWALAPDDPEPDYRDYRPRRDRRDGGDRRDLGRRETSGFAQNQNALDDQWQHGGNRDRSQRNAGYDEQGDRSNARSNGPSGRGWSQSPATLTNGPRRTTRGWRVLNRNSLRRLVQVLLLRKLVQVFLKVSISTRSIGEPKHDPWAVAAEQPAPEACSVAHSQSTLSSQSVRLPSVPETDGRDAFHTSAPRKEEGKPAPSADEWVANHDPWAVADENQGHQSQMLEPPKRETPSTIRGGGSPFRDRMNDNTNQNDRSVNEAPFSANVLDVRAPSQSNVAALAASRAGEMYDRRPDNNRSRNQEDELPAEFNYFMHSETVDWTSSGPTKASQNSFSPSQNLATQTPPIRETSATISAPTPRPTDYFDYSQQAADNFNTPAVREDTIRAPAPRENNFRAEVPDSNSFVLGSMKTERYDSYADNGYKGRERSASQWGPSDRERSDGGRGRGRDSVSPGYGAARGRRGDDYGCRDDGYGQGDGHGRVNDNHTRPSPYPPRGGKGLGHPAVQAALLGNGPGGYGSLDRCRRSTLDRRE